MGVWLPMFWAMLGNQHKHQEVRATGRMAGSRDITNFNELNPIIINHNNHNVTLGTHV